MNLPSQLSFLETAAGYAQTVGRITSPSATAPILIAVIDPAYVPYSYPGTKPKVTFEGEDTLTDKRYSVLGDYLPLPSARVIMLPVGHTYVIAGPIDTPPAITNEAAASTAQVQTASTTFVALGTLTTSIDLRIGQDCRVVVQGELMADASGATAALAGFRMTGASGTREPIDSESAETGNLEWTPFYVMNYITASVAGTHNFEMRHRVIGTTNGLYKFRRLFVEAM